MKKDDLISRSAMISRIKEYASNAYEVDLDDSSTWAANTITNNYSQGLSEAIELIEDAPAVKAAPVVHARWIEEDGCYLCSACGNPAEETTDYISTNGQKTTEFCHRCGAIMDAEEGAGE